MAYSKTRNNTKYKIGPAILPSIASPIANDNNNGDKIACTKVSFELTTGTFDLQANFFDMIMPKILPLLLTLGVFYLMDKKGWSSLKTMLWLIVAGVVLGLIGII